jgi:UDP-N-acetylglucosamine:LPS N-acetylglucosamine transferase
VFSYFPLVECMRAFDGALSSCGTNGSAELVQARVPMVWLPLGRDTQDQMGNAQRYLQQGIGLTPMHLTAEAFAVAAARILEPARAEAMRERMRTSEVPNGADLAAGLIRDWSRIPIGMLRARRASPPPQPAEA